MADVLMTGEEVRAVQVQAAISIRSDRPETENRHHGDVVNICNDWLYLTRENDAARARLESAVGALREAERRCQVLLNWGEGKRCWLCGHRRGSPDDSIRHYKACPFAALGAAGEEQDNG